MIAVFALLPALAFVSTAIASVAREDLPASRPELLEHFIELQTGTFTSEVQARQDARYATAIWHVAEIWSGLVPDTRWLYTESWIKDAKAPYMQRISRVYVTHDGSIIMERYTIADAGRLVGAWRDPASFPAFDSLVLDRIEGCEAMLARTGPDRYEGGTGGHGCRNDYKGASYAVSHTSLTRDGMTNWDRGFNAAGELVWGPAAGGYQFRREGADDSCVDPVRMLVYGTITDRRAFGAYARALAESGLYPENGGYYEAITPPLDVFEGDPPDGRGVIIARFPCLAAAQRFWKSDEYAEIRKLREGIAEFEVLVLPVPPRPDDLED
jgi:uncharacterized protein (DUF1330 family)